MHIHDLLLTKESAVGDVGIGRDRVQEKRMWHLHSERDRHVELRP
jgi:hypothetical protein